MDCLDALEVLITLARKIRKTFDTASAKGEKSNEMLNDLICIHNICSSIYVPHGARLAKDLVPIESYLSQIRRQREAIINQTGPELAPAQVYFFMRNLIANGHRIVGDLSDVHERIQKVHEGFKTMQVSRIDIFDRIHAKLDVLISNAETNYTLARRLVKIFGAGPYSASYLLRRCQKVINSKEAFGLELRYLKLKAKILRGSSSNVPFTLVGTAVEGPISPSPSSSSESVSHGMRDENKGPKDGVQELLKLSKHLRSKEKSCTNAIPLIQRLINMAYLFGMLEEAAVLGEWVVDIFLGFVESGDEAHKMSLVKSRIDHVKLLIAAGQKPRSVDVAKANVEMCREEAKGMPRRWLPLLAEALRNQSAAFHNSGNHEEEISALVESVDAHGRHAECDDGPTSFHSVHYQPDHLSSTLALALNDLSARFYILSRYTEAIDASKASLALYQNLVDTPSKDALPGLAASYETLSSSLIALENRDDAIAALEKSTKGYSKLAKDQPATFLSEFARVGKKLCDQLTQCGRYDDALKVLDDVICLHRDFIADDIPSLLADLAACLTIKSTKLCLLLRYEDALTAATESVSTHRRITPATGAVKANLAFSLDGLAWSLHKLGHDNAALLNIDEALRSLSSIKDEVEPSCYESVKQACLRTQTICLAQLLRKEKATKVRMEIAKAESTMCQENSGMDANQVAELSIVSRGLHKIGSSTSHQLLLEKYPKLLNL